jgi:hypothetical protein
LSINYSTCRTDIEIELVLERCVNFMSSVSFKSKATVNPVNEPPTKMLRSESCANETHRTLLYATKPAYETLRWSGKTVELPT